MVDVDERGKTQGNAGWAWGISIKTLQQYTNQTEAKYMCSVGDVVGIDVKTLSTSEYECLDCNNKFKGIGKRVKCPTCKSSNVRKIG